MPSPVLSLPGPVARSRFGLQSNTQTFRSPLTGHTQTLERPGARWTAEYTPPPLKRADVALWQSFLARLRGGAGRFYGSDPDARMPRGAALALTSGSTNALTNGNAVGAVLGTEGAGGQLPTGWAWGNANGLTRQIVASGVDNGVASVEIRFSGTPTNTTSTLNFCAARAIPALSGEVWFSALSYRVTAGSMTNVAGVYQRIEQVQATGATLNTNSLLLVSPDPVWRRSAHTKTLTSTTPATAYVRNSVYLALTAGQPVDLTLRVGHIQLEKSPDVTSYIPTSGTARTRGAGARVDGDSTGGTTLTTWNWSPNVSALLRAGDYLAFDTSAGRALHMVVADVASDANGRAVVSVEPPLRLFPPDNTPLIITNPACVMALVDDSVVWETDAAGTYRLSFSAEERF